MKTSSRLPFWTSCLGNLFEHYDTALFSFLSPFLAPLMFPDQDPITALILTYAMIPLSMIARPIGSLVFGYIGDTHGRRQALFLTLAGMSFASGCLALSPSFAQVGLFAPLLFCLVRVLQNFFAAGETMGGAIFLLEHSPTKKHDFLSGLYNSTTMGGHLLASFAVFLLIQYNVVDTGWRFLYLLGCITALFGALIRRSPEFEPVSIPASQSPMQLKSVLWTHRKSLLAIAICAGFGSSCYAVAIVLTSGLIPLISTITKAEIMKMNTYLLVFDFCMLPFFGWVASKISREKLMLSAALTAVLLGVPLFLSLQEASLLTVLGARAVFVLIGVAFFAPFHAWASALVPSQYRYVVISFGYALGYQLLGSPTAALALWCFQQTGMVASVAWYWMFLALASTLTVATVMRSSKSLKDREIRDLPKIFYS